MVIDLKSIMIDQFTSMFENHLGLIAIVFALAIVAFLFQHKKPRPKGVVRVQRFHRLNSW